MKQRKLFGKMIAGIVMILFLISCGSQENKATSESQVSNYSKGMSIGVALYSFNRFPFVETLEKAELVGAEVVEGFFFHKLGGEFDNQSMGDLNDSHLKMMKNLVDTAGLRMLSVYAGANTRDEWIRFYEMGKILELEFLVGEPEPVYWDLLDSLSGATGIGFAIHEHARGKSRYWHPDSALAALEGHPNLGACGDLGHWVRSGLDPVTCLKALEGHLTSIHAKDLDEFGNVEADDVRIGSGVIDYKAVMQELLRQGFTGPVYIECEHDWESNLEDVKYAVEYLREI